MKKIYFSVLLVDVVQLSLEQQLYTLKLTTRSTSCKRFI